MTSGMDENTDRARVHEGHRTKVKEHVRGVVPVRQQNLAELFGAVIVEFSGYRQDANAVGDRFNDRESHGLLSWVVNVGHTPFNIFVALDFEQAFGERFRQVAYWAVPRRGCVPGNLRV